MSKSHSFLVHVKHGISHSKTITLPQCRLFSSIKIYATNQQLISNSQSTNYQPILVSLKRVRVNSAFVKQQKNCFSATSVVTRERDPKDDPAAEEKGTSSKDDNHKHDGNGNNEGHQLQKPTVPEVYPQLLALPITRRPLFPGFYKAVVIKDPDVTAAIKELLKRGQPYVGAFLIKDDKLDIDKISSMDQVYDVGVFAQITSIFPSGATTGEEGNDPGLTAVLYPHRRIKLTEIVPQKEKSLAKVEETEKKPIDVKEDGVGNEKGQKEKVDKKQQRTVKAAPTVEVTDKKKGEEPKEKKSRKEDVTDFLLHDFDVSVGKIENLQETPLSKKSPLVRAVTSELVAVFKDIAQLNPLFRDQIASFSMSQSAGNVFEEPSKLADFAAAVSVGESAELQDVLATLPVEERLQKSLLVLKKELMNAQLQNKISKEVESKIAKRQREYYLMEQLKGIKKELGIETDGKDKLIERFKEKAQKLIMPEAAAKVFNEEINKLSHLEAAASEFNVTRNYLDWITQIPWGKRSRENYNLKHARTILNEDHYGLKDVKDRILEFIAVGKLRGTVEGKIICLSGPPGVGKTSVGKSIARALDREFYRFSVGGLTDVAEIKGHRRTYVGAMPGKVIQALKKVGTENPLILIDEVDKIGRGHQGDPSSALLELLDPEQNSGFLDHYMDIPVDLSKVLFMCTANVLDTIPGPLLDRMEIIQLSGYVAEEKQAIALKYLVPAAKINSGLENVHITLTDDAIKTLIKSYCRESGVRNLKKQIDKVFRKAAYKVVEEVGDENLEQLPGDSEKVLSADIRSNDPKVHEKAEEGSPVVEKEKGQEIDTAEERKPLHVPNNIEIEIDTKTLRDYIGPVIFHSDRLYNVTPPGVVMGLAWTSMGGASLYVESVLESSLTYKATPHLSKTGQLGDVMKESSIIAYTFAKSLLAHKFPENKFFDKAHVHLHCPAGAVPKDGPSAGITMATALISLALDQPVDSNIAMTGELTVTGKVLQIGGLKEKVIAAKRSQVTTVLFPKENESDWEELDDYIKEDIKGIPVNMYDDVFKVVFANIDLKKAENPWEKELAKPPKEELKEEKEDR